MAYNHGFNPDALPAHAEPEQAAQLFARDHPPATTKPPSLSTSPAAQSYLNKPPPPIPQQQPPRQSPPNSHPPHQAPQYQQALSQPPSQYHSSQDARRPAQYQRHSSAGNASSSNPYTNANPSHSHDPSPQNTPQSSYSSKLGPPPSSLAPAPLSISPRNTPNPNNRPAPSTGGASTDASLFPLFRAVDKRGVGQLSEDELQTALVNGDFSRFDLDTVRMMIRMFDVDGDGTIGFEEFCGLWGFLAAWRTLFDRFDEDRSGTISYDEYSKALLAFGYHLSPTFVAAVYRQYDRRATGTMSFDMFVQSCIRLKKMTDIFKRYDTDRDGFVTLSFEEFLTEILLGTG